MTGWLIAAALWAMVAGAEYGRLPDYDSKRDKAEAIIACAGWPVWYLVRAWSALQDKWD